MKKYRIIGIISAVFGLLFLLNTDDTFLPLFLLLGGAFMIVLKVPKKEVSISDNKPEGITGSTLKTDTQELQKEPLIGPSKKIITYSIYPAWSNKYNGIKDIIKDIKAENKPYEGYTAKEIREHFETGGDTVYQYPQTEIRDIKFVPEPDNQYNPNAVQIISDKYGMIGYVPDKNLSRVKGILNKHPDADIYLDIYGGNFKFWDDGEYGEERVRTVKNELRHKLRFEYDKNR